MFHFKGVLPMRINDKILLENIEDYFNHKGLSPHLIDDIKKVITDIKILKRKIKIILNIKENLQHKSY